MELFELNGFRLNIEVVELLGHFLLLETVGDTFPESEVLAKARTR